MTKVRMTMSEMKFGTDETGAKKVSFKNMENYAEDGVVHGVYGWNSLSNSFVLDCGERRASEYDREGWTDAKVTCVMCLSKTP